MQLTEDLCRVAMACQDKYERMGGELGSNVLFYRLGYAWVLYEPDEVERMRAIVAMHARLGITSALLSPTRRSATCRCSRAASRSPARC